MSVHAPLTFLLATPFADGTAIVFHRTDLWLLGAITTAAALGLGVLAATLGALDFETARAKAPRTVLWHAGAMGAAIALEGISLVGRVSSNGVLEAPPSAFSLIAGAAAFVVAIVGAYFGGDLVYRHGANVERDAP